MRNILIVAGLAAAILSSSGCVEQQREREAQAAKAEQMDKEVAQAKTDMAALRADLDATRARLDNALRASADTSGDTIASKQRINDLSGKVEEVTHGIDELRRDVGASRTELYARLDEVKRTQQQPAPPPPAPIAVPADKAAHYKQLEDAHAKRDWVMVRTLAPEYVNRYATDDKADEALLYLGSADLQDGRPSSALGHFNRLLKLFPHSNVLDRTLYAMGDAYLLMHDCANAKMAYDACEKRFTKDKIGAEAKAKVSQIGKSPPGMCAPP